MTLVHRVARGLLCAILTAAAGAPAAAQFQLVVAVDGQADDWLGYSTAHDGAHALLGAPQEDQAGSDAGAAYFYQGIPSVFVQRQKVVASQAQVGDRFGWSVALHGDVAVVGAPGQGLPGSLPGSAYVYERVGGNWLEVARLPSPFSLRADHFGAAVAVHGDRIAIGAYSSSAIQSKGGIVFVYEREPNGWQLVEQVFPGDLADGDAFGFAVALDAERLVVGAYNHDSAGPNAGAAYVYRNEPNSWVLESKLVSPSPDIDDHFGRSVTIDGLIVGCGAPEDDDHGVNHGSAYLFERQGAAWNFDGELIPSDGAAGDAFGYEIRVAGGSVLVSAPAHDATAMNAGAAYSFVPNGPGWMQGQKLALQGSAGDYVGLGLSFDGVHALVGAMRADPMGVDSGGAYAVPTSSYGGAWHQAFCFCDPGPCGSAPGAGCPNSSGLGGQLLVSGSPSVVADDLALTLSALPSGALAFLLMGGGVGDAVVGDGRFCLASGGLGLYRFGLGQADGSGDLTYGPGFAAASQSLPPVGHILAGQYRVFQGWYRDAQSPCGGGSNMTHAVAVTFAP